MQTNTRVARTIWAAAMVFAAAFQAHAADAPGRLWSDFDAVAERNANDQPWIVPQKYRAVRLDREALAALRSSTPLETSVRANADQPAILELPLPAGGYSRFAISESPIMEPGLAAKFPEIKTYVGHGLDDRAATLRADWTPQGFHAQVLSPNGTFYIDPMYRANTEDYTVHARGDLLPTNDFTCFEDTSIPALPELDFPADMARSGTKLQTFRLACAATAEYTTFHGGTVPMGQGAIVTAINRVSGVYELELAVRFTLVANNSDLVFTDAVGDGYTNNNGSTMLGQNQTKIDAVIGTANYDMGHVFSTGGGGIATLSSVCGPTTKARGVTGLPSPTGDEFYIDFVAHEMGHQFGGRHTFDGIVGNCGGANRADISAYEPGSGTTIMAYAGICGADNIQAHSDPQFHFRSFDEILFFLSTSACDMETATGNTVPVVSAGAGFVVPQSTPFTATATGSDANGDTLTFSWEQRDQDDFSGSTLSVADEGSKPLFRSFPPTISPSRTFPQMSSILTNTFNLTEKFPIRSRYMDLRVTARDNRAGGGGVNTSDVVVRVSGTGPFAVTYPNTATTVGPHATVTWDLGGTKIPPISTSNVNILLSKDGGLTFPTVLASNTPNDGSQNVDLPGPAAPAARIKIEPVGNSYFDISNVDFTFDPAQPVFFTLTGTKTVVDSDLYGFTNGVPDPGDTIQLTLGVRNQGAVTATGITATLLSLTSGVVVSTPNSTYASMASNGTGSNLTPFVLEVDESFPCGQPINLQLDLASAQGGASLSLQLAGGKPGTPQTFSYTGAPVNIPDMIGSTPGTVDIPISIPDIGRIADLDFRFDGTVSSTNSAATTVGLNHEWVGDLKATLISPTGTQVIFLSRPGLDTVWAGQGSTGNNFYQTSFDDESNVLNIQDVLPANEPHTGSHRPFQALSAFDTQLSAGTWTLRISDNRGAFSGTVRAFSLIVTPVVCAERESAATGWRQYK